MTAANSSYRPGRLVRFLAWLGQRTRSMDVMVLAMICATIEDHHQRTERDFWQTIDRIGKAADLG